MPGGGSWLDLLANDASADDLEAHRQAAQETAGSAAERDAVDVDARRALHLRALLTERRQRTAELGALLDLARRLSGFRDVDALLQEIVTQARRLLSVDVAYLALVEPGGDLRIRVTDGTIGDGLRGTVLSASVGIAGRVAMTGEPFRTPDYVAEPDIEHKPQIDSIATREGLRAIAGVPLRAGDTMRGVLFASERERRDFTDAEVSLLSSLGAHAAIAIENARLFEELLDANAQLRQQHDTTQRAVALHESLTRVVLEGGSADDILRALADVVPGTMRLLSPGDDGAATHNGEGHRTTVPVTAGDDVLGSLVAVTDQPPSPAEVRLLERSALTLALVLLSDRTVAEAQSRTRSELLAALLAGAPSPDDVARLRASGVDVRKPLCIAVIEPAPDVRGRAVLDHVGDVGLTAEHDGVVVCVAAGETATVAADVEKRVGSIDATAVVTAPTTGAPGLAAAYVEARQGLGLLRALGRAGSVVTIDELGPFRFLFGPAGVDDANRFVERTIGPLLAYDAGRHSDLILTLELYLDHAQQHAASAAALGIHANTLYQRLGRISELLGDDWRARALEVHLAIRLHRLSSQLVG